MPTHTHAGKVRATTSNYHRKRTKQFNNRKSREIFEKIYIDNNTARGEISTKNYKKIRETVDNGLGNVMRRSEGDECIVIVHWKPMGKKPRGRPRKR